MDVLIFQSVDLLKSKKKDTKPNISLVSFFCFHVKKSSGVIKLI